MRKIAFIFLSLILISSCTNENNTEDKKQNVNVIDTYEERVEEIKTCEALLKGDSMSFNVANAERMVAAYVDFFTNHKLEEENILYIFKAGEISKGLGKPHDAIKYFNILLEDYAIDSHAALALFYKATILDDDLNEDENARIYYEEFLKKYPDHYLSESAKAAISHLGKTLEEIVAGFEEKES